MWQFTWDTIGYIHDSVPRWAKIAVASLILVTVGFFFGYRASLYVAAVALWIAVAFLIIAHVVILSRNLRKQREAPPTPLTPTDRADVEEFQAAMQGTELAQSPAYEQTYQSEQYADQEPPVPPAVAQ